MIDVELSEDADDEDFDPMSKAEMRIEDAIHAFESTPLNLRRIRSWLRGRVSAAAHEQLLKSDFRALMSEEEYASVMASARKNFCPTITRQWLGETKPESLRATTAPKAK
ncbi:MAG TPA: hypothetical protein PK264_10965 [Hyphomicrobiaceae bacterium]|nr:hypothetical protein [Hyphomicrobiaceae bacterium]